MTSNGGDKYLSARLGCGAASVVIMLLASALCGCASLPASGPSRAGVRHAVRAPSENGIRVVDVDENVTRRLLASRKQSLFSEVFGQAGRTAYVLAAGDIIEVSVWEAPPATLFGGATADCRTGIATARVTSFPEQMVGAEGNINIPFAGQIQAAGRSPHQLENAVALRLKDKANQPQVLVRLIRNNTADVTVVGEVNSSLRMPLTARGERLLDALAAAGGVRQPVTKMTLQLSRANQVAAMPLDAIIRDPAQNIVLKPADVITLLYQPFSFTVLGATGRNEEVNFEAQGISLAQALARAGGLQDARADVRGVFLFRFESPQAMAPDGATLAASSDRIPVVYRLNLADPALFFVAQNFPVENRDVLYVANAPAAELQKFLNILTASVYSIINIKGLRP